jgi:ketosteroid isomerase-like protein
VPAASTKARRPATDRVEIAAPALASLIARAVSRAPATVRLRVLADAFARAQAAFNRGDFKAVFALFADDVYYVPPPALSEEPLKGRTAVLDFWQSVARRFDTSTIENLSLEETEPRRFVRTARITHRTGRDEFSYVIRQVTELRGGRVVVQINEQIA